MPVRAQLLPQLIAWFGATVCTMAIVIVFVFTTFQTQSNANKSEETVIKRLENIDQKIDHLIDFQMNSKRGG